MSSLLSCSSLIMMEVKTRYKSPFFINTKPFPQGWLSAWLHDAFCDKSSFSGWDMPSLLARSLSLATETDVTGTESKAMSLLCRVAPEKGKTIFGSATPNLCKCLMGDEYSLKSIKMAPPPDIHPCHSKLHFLATVSQPEVHTKNTNHGKSSFNFIYI